MSLFSRGFRAQKKKIRSEYRQGILSTIGSLGLVDLDERQVEVASKYIKFPLSYSSQSAVHPSLRPDLEVEFSFTQPRLLPKLKSVQSLVSQFTASEPETNILCLSAIQTGADKLSALTWRLLRRERSDPSDDPAIIRHLHDLCALAPVIEAHRDSFIKTAQASFEDDQKTGRRVTGVA